MSQQGEKYYLAPTTQDPYFMPPDPFQREGYSLEVDVDPFLIDSDEQLDDQEIQDFLDGENEIIERARQEALQERTRENAPTIEKTPVEETPTYDTWPDEDEPQVEQAPEKLLRHVKWNSRFKRWGSVALSLSFIGAANNAIYFGDARVNMIAEAKARTTVIDVYPALENDTTKNATVMYDGFNTYGARNFARTLGDSIQLAFPGEGMSVQYNNGAFEAAKITPVVDKKLARYPEVNGADVVSHSLGIIPATKYIADKSNNTWFPVETATLIAGPANFDGLTDKTQHELRTAEDLAWIPLIEYSSLFRYLLEMNFYQDDIKKNVSNALAGINDRFAKGNTTSNAFLARQIKAAINADVPGTIASIKDAKFRTIFNIVKLTHDSVVDKDDSAEKICKAVIAIGHICNVFEIDDGHGEYYQKSSQEIYKQLFKDIAAVNKPQLEAERARFAMIRQAYFGEDTMLANAEQ